MSAGDGRTVWIVNHYAIDPAHSAGGARHFSLARRLSELGWNPIVIAATTAHNGRIKRIPPGAKVTERDGVTFRWIRALQYRGNGVARILNMAQFTLALLNPFSTSGLAKPDVIIGSTVHPFGAWAASRLAKRRRVPFVFEIRDLWPQTFIDMGKMAQDGLPARLLRRLEGHLCRRADHIVTLLPYAHEYLARHGVQRSDVTWISNGTTVAAEPPAPRRTADPFVFRYVGSLGTANGMSSLISGFALTRDTTDRASVLEIVGDGPARAALQTQAEELGLTQSVRFHGSIPKSEVARSLSDSDALVLNLLDLPLYRYGISLNKLFDYLAAARPIIIASNSRNNPVLEADAGVPARADDPESISQAMLQVMHASAADRERWGANAWQHVREHYDYGVLGDELNRLLTSLVTKQPATRRD